MASNSVVLIENLEKITSELLAKMGLEVKTQTKIDLDPAKNEEMVILNIESADASLLIGERGSNLLALQHLLRALMKRKSQEDFKFTIDVNHYREERQGFLEELALNSARKVKATGEKVVLRPMSAYERRLVHQVLAADEGVMTESIGEEPERKIVIKLNA